MCTTCCKEIENDLNLQIREAEEDIFAYETCLKRWEQEAEEAEPLEQLAKSLEEVTVEFHVTFGFDCGLHLLCSLLLSGSES